MLQHFDSHTDRQSKIMLKVSLMDEKQLSIEKETFWNGNILKTISVLNRLAGLFMPLSNSHSNQQTNSKILMLDVFTSTSGWFEWCHLRYIWSRKFSWFLFTLLIWDGSRGECTWHTTALPCGTLQDENVIN